MECRVHILHSCAHRRLQLHWRSRQQLTPAADGLYAHRCWYGAYQACGKTDIISIEHERESGSFDRIANSSPYVLKLFDKELSSDCFNRGFLSACLLESLHKPHHAQLNLYEYVCKCMCTCVQLLVTMYNL